jgi:hypothetical protein
MSGELNEKDVLNFIQSRPDFLETHFGLTAKNQPANLIDVTGKIAANAREEARRLSEANQYRLDAALASLASCHAGVSGL